MDRQLLSMSKLFSDRLFRIPDYQRGYAWTDKEIAEFWGDLMQLEDDKSHYTGVLTLEEVPKSVHAAWHEDKWIIEARNFEPFYVVDGQQRITTILIMISALLDLTPKDKMLNYTPWQDIQKRYVFDSKDGGHSRSYIFNYEPGNPSYEHLKVKVFGEFSSGFRSDQATTYTQNLDRAKQFFTAALEKMDAPGRERIFKKITQQFVFNVFTMGEEVEVCVAFETMNNRGKKLSVLELLKNRLIYLTLKFPDLDGHDKASLRKQVNDCWRAIYHSLGRNKENVLDDDEFLACHNCLYHGPTMLAHDPRIRARPARFRSVFTIHSAEAFLLRQHFVLSNVSVRDGLLGPPLTAKDLRNYVESLQKAIDAWYLIHNPTIAEVGEDVAIWLDKINRLEEEDVYPLVLAAFLQSHSRTSVLEFLQAIERGVVLRSMVTVGDYRWGFWIEAAIALYSGKRSIEDTTALLHSTNQKIAEGTDRVREMRSSFSRGFYAWDGLAYFLFEYELHLQAQSKAERQKIFWPEFTEKREDYVTIEHIYPQTATAGYWKSNFPGLNQTQRDALRNSLGNLLALSRPKNSSLSNKPFPDKVQGDLVVGYRYGSYSENEVAKNSDWTPELILSRGVHLLKFMETRWGIALGDDSDKQHILNLSFVKPGASIPVTESLEED